MNTGCGYQDIPESRSRRGNVLLARGLNRFDNWFDKDMDDFANEKLGWQATQPQWLVEGRFKEDAMEDKLLAAIGPIPSGLCMCGGGQKTKIVTKSDRRHGHVMRQPFRFIHGHSRPAEKGPNRFKLRRRTAVTREAVALMDALFAVERQAKDVSVSERLELRW